MKLLLLLLATVTGALFLGSCRPYYGSPYYGSSAYYPSYYYNRPVYYSGIRYQSRYHYEQYCHRHGYRPHGGWTRPHHGGGGAAYQATRNPAPQNTNQGNVRGSSQNRVYSNVPRPASANRGSSTTPTSRNPRANLRPMTQAQVKPDARRTASGATTTRNPRLAGAAAARSSAPPRANTNRSGGNQQQKKR